MVIIISCSSVRSAALAFDERRAEQTFARLGTIRSSTIQIESESLVALRLLAHPYNYTTVWAQLSLASGSNVRAGSQVDDKDASTMSSPETN